MALGNEVVEKNDPESEISLEDLIADITDPSEPQVKDDVQAEVPVEIEIDIKTEEEVTTDTEEKIEVPVVDTNDNANTEETAEDVNENVNAEETVEDVNENANTEESAEDVNENANTEKSAEDEEEDEPDLIPEAEAEDEDEPDLIDPVTEIREKCESQQVAQKYFSMLEECNNRVNSRTKTDETCHEEMMDYVHAVDHCVAHDLFAKIK